MPPPLSRRLVQLASIGISGAIPTRRRVLPPDHGRVVFEDPDFAFSEAGRLEARRLVTALPDALGLPSLSAALAVDGRVVWSIGCGHADLRAEAPVEPQTRYRAGSIAKGFTAALLIDASERDLIDLDAEAGHYLGDRAGTARRATLRQIATHTAGVRHYAGTRPRAVWREQFSRRHWSTSTEALDLFASDPLLFEPGRGFRYSTHGYTLIGAALEQVHRQSFASILRDRLTEPLGLTGTTLEDPRRPSGRTARHYVGVGQTCVEVPTGDPSYKWPGAGLLTTPTDLVRFADALMSGDFVSPEGAGELWSRADPHVHTNPSGYGMGWGVSRSARVLDLDSPQLLVRHLGLTRGGTAFLALLPEHRIAIAVMANRGTNQEGSRPLREAAYRMAGAHVGDPASG